MAFNHIETNQQLQPASRLVSALQQIKQGVAALADERAILITRIDGSDPSQDANYAEVVIRYGVDGPDQATRLAKAHAMFSEIDSLFSKVGTDAPTSSVNAAILQAVSKIR